MVYSLELRVKNSLRAWAGMDPCNSPFVSCGLNSLKGVIWRGVVYGVTRRDARSRNPKP